MLTDGAHVFLKKLRHEFLRQPNGFVLKSHLQPNAAIGGLVKEEFATGWCGCRDQIAHGFSFLSSRCQHLLSTPSLPAADP